MLIASTHDNFFKHWWLHVNWTDYLKVGKPFPGASTISI